MSVAGPGWTRALDGLHILVAAVALAFCFRAASAPFGWLILPVGFAVLRVVCDAQFRERLRGLWASLARFRQGGPLPWLAALVVVAVPALVLLVSSNHKLAFGDSWPVVPTACSLLMEGDAELSEFLGDIPASYCPAAMDYQPYCLTRTPQGLYSSYPSGMVQFSLPVCALARLAGADLKDPRVRDRLEKWCAALVAALALALFFLVALHLAEPAPAWTAVALLASGSVMFSTVGHGLWQHGGVILWSMVILLVEFRGAKHPSRWGVAVQGLACGLMLACRLSAGVIVVPFGLWVLLRAPRRAVAVALVAALTCAPWAWWHYSVYGTPVGPSTGQLAGGNWVFDFEQQGTALLGLLVSPARGLLVYQPWLLLGGLLVVPGLGQRILQGATPEPAGWRWFVLVVAGLYLGMVASWGSWWGGHCWGSRLLAEIIPLCALLCLQSIAALWRNRPGRLTLAAVALLSFFVHGVGVYVRPCWEGRVGLDQNLEMLWSWQRPPFLMLDRPRN